MNEAWDDVNKDGILYLIQPASLIGTNTIKIGESKGFEQRLDGRDYGKGTMVLETVHTTNRSGEHHLQKLFNDNGCVKKSDIGNEYYEVKSLGFAKNVFSKIVETIPELIDDEVHRYKIGEWIHRQDNNDDENDE